MSGIDWNPRRPPDELRTRLANKRKEPKPNCGDFRPDFNTMLGEDAGFCFLPVCHAGDIHKNRIGETWKQGDAKPTPPNIRRQNQSAPPKKSAAPAQQRQSQPPAGEPPEEEVFY